MEEVFAQAWDSEAESETPLVDDRWHAVEVEPEFVEARQNGDGVSVEVLSTNGHDGEVETQQSLFFWAEFLAETPAKPKGNGKSQLGTLSMFEWALSLEQNRE